MKGHTTALVANELPPDTRIGELQGGEERYRDYDPVENEPYGIAGRQATVEPPTEPSPHVQAQRRREVEWLESEEARMREQRERLMRQS